MKTPSEFFNKSVKGTLTTIELEIESGGKKSKMESGQYEFIDVVEQNDKKLFMTNQWHKEHNQEPLYIIEDLVKSVEYK